MFSMQYSNVSLNKFPVSTLKCVLSYWYVCDIIMFICSQIYVLYQFSLSDLNLLYSII